MFYYISVYIDIPDLLITLYYVILLDGDDHFCVSGHTPFAWHKSLPIPPVALYYYQKYSASLAAIFVHLFKTVFRYKSPFTSELHVIHHHFQEFRSF